MTSLYARFICALGLSETQGKSAEVCDFLGLCTPEVLLPMPVPCMFVR